MDKKGTFEIRIAIQDIYLGGAEAFLEGLIALLEMGAVPSEKISGAVVEVEDEEPS